MSIAENVAERLAYKFYASGDISANTKAVSSSDPGAASAQVLRFVDHNLSLAKDTYESTEIQEDRQDTDYRHGTQRIPGTIRGLLSPKTYGDFFQALFRGTWAAAVSKSNTELTSVAADNATAKFTFGGGDPVTEGLRVGHIIRFTNLSEALNNSRNFLILGFGGTSNREVTVYPAPTTMGADNAFTVVNFKNLINPAVAANFTKRKVAIESYQSDLDVAELFTEARIGGARIAAPATGLVTVDWTLLGRARESYSGGSAPFFTSPTAQTTTKLLASVNGLMRVGGVNVGVVTAFNLNIDLAGQGPAVLGQDFVPEIFNGKFNASGDFTAFFENLTLIDAFANETEIELLLYLLGSSEAAAQAISFYVPRIKLGGATKSNDASGGKIVQYPFKALRYVGAAAGVPSATMSICDTEVA